MFYDVLLVQSIYVFLKCFLRVPMLKDIEKAFEYPRDPVLKDMEKILRQPEIVPMCT